MNREVHPIAALFPMLPADELKALAEDIKTRGQLQPVVLDADGRVLDGRNRLAACELAEVEPQFTTYSGEDTDGYALAVNGQRRSQTKAQKALVGAAYLRNLSDSEKFGDQGRVARALGISQSTISEALLIREWAPVEAEEVAASVTPFSKALEIARDNKIKAEEIDAKKITLRRLAPDLADLFDEERMSLDDAMAALKAREEKASQDAAVNERAAKLPDDLADRVRVGLSIDEAEAINQERENRLDVWAEKIDQALTVLGRMIGHPIPDGIDTRLTETRYKALTDILNRTEGVHVDNL